MTTKPLPPTIVEPDPTWPHLDLWKAVQKAIFTLPDRFESDLVISGVLATDLHAFNSSLSATIEEQVIEALNDLRSIWDPNGTYALYSFERQPQTFPDVVLRTKAPGVPPKVLMGIELKGWYILAKEGEPSGRYKVTPQVCAPADLLVFVPWALSRVISGSPQVFEPFVIGARYASEYRNWWWEHEKGGGGDNRITLSSESATYPTKSKKISDKPFSDSGNNFGRLARAGLMDDFMKRLFDDELMGIQLWAWHRFLALFTESNSDETIRRNLDVLARRIGEQPNSKSEKIAEKLREISSIVEND